MFRKITVLAMAVGIVTAFALPAAASAEWKHTATPIQQNVTIPFTGNAAFQSQLGGVTCQVTSEVQFKAFQTKGTVQTFKVHPTDETTNCTGHGLLAPCQIHNVSPQTGFQWVIHTTGTNIQITNGTLTSQLTGGFCGVKKIQITPGNVTASPNQPTNVTSIALSGTLQAHLETNSGVVHATAISVEDALTIEKESGKKHTYSI